MVNFKWVALGAIAVGIPPILLKAIASARNLILDINTLMSVAVRGRALEPLPFGQRVAAAFLSAAAHLSVCVCPGRSRSVRLRGFRPSTSIRLHRSGRSRSVGLRGLPQRSCCARIALWTDRQTDRQMAHKTRAAFASTALHSTSRT
jgi:hypothetical protein